MNPLAMTYVWQMADGSWWISPLGGRGTQAMLETSKAMRSAGLDRSFATRAEADRALIEAMNTKA